MKRMIFLSWFLFSAMPAQAKLQIALTFDDAPRPNSYFTGMKRTKQLVRVLKEKGVKQAGFFCNTRDYSAEIQKRIQLYSDAGHMIANHTAHHLKYTKVGDKAFLSDIREAHEKLRFYPTFKRFFRSPYLDSGWKPSSEVVSGLRGLHYTQGDVTVETYDWYLDRLFQSDVRRKRPVEIEKLKSMYLDVLWDGIQFYDRLAKRVFNRSVSHVILLHENDINALFIGDLIDLIRKNDGEIISIESAYQDPIYFASGDAGSEQRLRYLAKYNGVPPQETVSKYEEIGVIQWQYEEVVHPW